MSALLSLMGPHSLAALQAQQTAGKPHIPARLGLVFVFLDNMADSIISTPNDTKIGANSKTQQSLSFCYFPVLLTSRQEPLVVDRKNYQVVPVRPNDKRQWPREEEVTAAAVSTTISRHRAARVLHSTAWGREYASLSGHCSWWFMPCSSSLHSENTSGARTRPVP